MRLSFLLEPVCLCLVAPVCARERADEQRALMEHTWRRHVRRHCLFKLLLQSGHSFPVAEQFLEHQAGGHAVQSMMR